MLEEILAFKYNEVANARLNGSEGKFQDIARARRDYRDFIAPLRTARNENRIGVIAELKRASPSAGMLREDYVPEQIAPNYERSGASCLSVLTDQKYFKGSMADLRAARAACTLPVLRKDFIFSTYQIYESAALGADAVLLIAGMFLQVEELKALATLAHEFGMSVLLEIHDDEEWNRCKDLAREKWILVGINNRNLRNFQIDTENSARLAPDVAAVSPNPVIAESGITEAKLMRDLHARGLDGFLIGGELMRSEDPGARLRTLLGESSHTVLH